MPSQWNKTYGPKVRWVSRVTLRIAGHLFRGATSSQTHFRVTPGLLSIRCYQYHTILLVSNGLSLTVGPLLWNRHNFDSPCFSLYNTESRETASNAFKMSTTIAIVALRSFHSLKPVTILATTGSRVELMNHVKCLGYPVLKRTGPCYSTAIASSTSY